MSLETQIANLVAATNQLTGEVSGKMAAINQTVDAKKAELDAWRNNARSEFPLGANLVKNALMLNYDTQTLSPTGYGSAGCTIEAVHPFTKGFEGPWLDAAPVGAVIDPNAATEQNPYWYGALNKGPRLSVGGLAGGWGGLNGGRILKITAPAEQTISGWRSIWLPVARNAFTTSVHLRCWLKLVSGSACGFGSDSGMNNNLTGHVVIKEVADQSPQGWHLVDVRIGHPDTAALVGNSFTLGFRRNEAIEAYLALPYVAALASTDGMTE